MTTVAHDPGLVHDGRFFLTGWPDAQELHVVFLLVLTICFTLSSIAAHLRKIEVEIANDRHAATKWTVHVADQWEMAAIKDVPARMIRASKILWSAETMIRVSDTAVGPCLHNG